ncbi:MAG: HK97 family phage prohead protease [Bacilli bacterium]|nr:HK97 family phage prohead protease [Bacilli bacterium]DAV15273.1 MAG TPA: prohead serine protease [Caudoviricetes sp.]
MKMPNPNIEYRFQKRNADVNTQEGIIEGYPIVFNERTAIGDYFYEEIDPHALDNADLSDIKLLVNHDDSMIPIARHRRGKRSTMDVNINENGMFIKAIVDKENNSDAKKLCSAIERGDIEDMSFCFAIEIEDGGDEWFNIDAEMPVRRIMKIRKVYEVSAVNDGAYPQTSINARSLSSLDNEKMMVANIKAKALENESRSSDTEKLDFEKRKLKFREEQK